MENAFDALCSALAEPELKETFLESEGVELMVICMKEKKMSRSRSIKVRPRSARAGRCGGEC
jgi:beta-catenin-like protein 1